MLAQLPPEIMLDSNLLRAEQSAREGDHVGARAAMARISELQEEHDLVPSAEYHYRYARVWDAVEDWNRALASVVRYLELEGREGQYYRDALALMNNATAAIEKIDRARELRAAERARARAAAVRAREEMDRALNAARELIPQLEFVSVPAGTFRMGASDRRAGTLYYPRTRVRISRPYEIGRYEITQDEWQAVMGSNPSRFAGCGRCPVESVSWEDVQRFITILNSVDDSTWTYRLPTEAEWEYAARAGERAERLLRIHWRSSRGSGTIAGTAPTRSAGRDRTGSACTTCTETWGRSSRTGTPIIRAERWWTRRDPCRVTARCSVVAITRSLQATVSGAAAIPPMLR